MNLIKKIRFRFHSKLPLGLTEFYSFVDDVAELSELPNNDKLKAVIASFITRLPPQMISFSKWDLAKQLKKAAANQVAFEAMSLMKENEKEETKIAEGTPNALGQKAS